MRKTTEAELLNIIMKWLSDEHERCILGMPRLQHDFAIHFVGMGHGWVEFNLEFWDGKTAFLEAWVDREETELTIGDRESLCENIPDETRWRMGVVKQKT
tara:strand:+ start:2475 stop:2774 length:300 start_codon:yes stop_codon:yes gene_type:complete